MRISPHTAIAALAAIGLRRFFHETILAKFDAYRAETTDLST